MKLKCCQYSSCAMVLALILLSLVYTGRDRQCDCNATAVAQNGNIGIQQEHLHSDMPHGSRRAPVTSMSGNLVLNLYCEQLSLMNTDLRNCPYMDYMMKSHMAAAYHVTLLPRSKSCCSMSCASRTPCHVLCKSTFKQSWDLWNC